MSAMPILEILTIGREILDGRVIDTNSVWLAERLREIGVVPRQAQRVDDEMDRVVEAFKIAGARSQIILVTGGLGPTADDLTAEAFGKFLGEKLEMNAEAFRQVEEIFRKLGRPLLDTQKKQAMLPRSCEVMENTQGTAPGFALHTKSGQSWYFMPGVPKEMKAMFTAKVLPRIPKVEGYRSSQWATQFTSEGELQSKLTSVHQALPADFEITYRTRFPENHIGLHGVCRTAQEKALYEKLGAEIGSILGTTVFSGGVDRDIRSLEAEVLERVIARGQAIGTAESCTGGLIANRITDVPGSSAAFWGSWVTYDNRAKVALGVDAKLIASRGAVSSAVAESLAQSGLAELIRMGAPNPICVATTGIAGPSGGTAEKPVGLCYVAVAIQGQPTKVQEVRGRIALLRAEYKQLFAQKALELVRQQLL